MQLLVKPGQLLLRLRGSRGVVPGCPRVASLGHGRGANGLGHDQGLL